jgi:hypothetical protein
MAFTTMSVAQARELADSAENKYKTIERAMLKLREKAEGAIGTGIQVAEVSGSAFAWGYANGRWGENGELTLGGMPVDLGVAVALHGVAFLGGLGKYAEHGHNLGTGALAACAYRTGSMMGAQSATKSNQQDAADQGAKNSQLPPWMLPPWQPAPQQPPAVAPPQPQPQPQAPHFAPAPHRQ